MIKYMVAGQKNHQAAEHWLCSFTVNLFSVMSI